MKSNALKVDEYLSSADFKNELKDVLGISLKDMPMCSCAIDSGIPKNPSNLLPEEALALIPEALNDKNDNELIYLGHYLEPRLIYRDRISNKS